MRRLILFRHAKAEPRAAGQDDFDRPLTERGREDALIVAKALADEGVAPDLVLVSPSRRTTETWTYARDAFPPAKAELVRDLYNAPSETIREAIEEAKDRCQTLMVVGHNPGLHELAVDILIEDNASATVIEPVAERFPTATAAVYRVDPHGRESFEELYLAKDLGGEGES
jgi:phosphohistidine phosphatase